jgi:hypothetical protein
VNDRGEERLRLAWPPARNCKWSTCRDEADRFVCGRHGHPGGPARAFNALLSSGNHSPGPSGQAWGVRLLPAEALGT